MDNQQRLDIMKQKAQESLEQTLLEFDTIGNSFFFKPKRKEVFQRIVPIMIYRLNNIFEIKMPPNMSEKFFIEMAENRYLWDENMGKGWPAKFVNISIVKYISDALSLESKTIVRDVIKVLGYFYIETLSHYFDLEKGQVVFPNNSKETMDYFKSLLIPNLAFV